MPRLSPSSRGTFFGVVGADGRRLRAATPGRRVALIFDDGPGRYTRQVVRELQRTGARATFFLIGQEVARRPQLAWDLHAARMELGNHTWSHRVLPSLAKDGQRKEIALGQAEIERATGVRPRLLRPPQAIWDEDTARAVAAEKVVGVLHSIETHDYLRPSPEGIIAAAESAEPGDSIAMHDAGGDRSATVAAVGPIVRSLRRRGLEAVTVGELMGYPPPEEVQTPRGW